MRLGAHERRVKPPPHQLRRQVRRVLACDGQLHVGQLIVKNAHRLRQPVNLRPGEETKRKGQLERFRGPPRRFDRSLYLGEREPRMVEEGAACGRQFDPAHAAQHQRDPDLIFEVAHLTAERRLRGMQPLLSRDRQAALFGDRDEIAKMPELHRRLPYPQGMPASLQSLFLRCQGRLHTASTIAGMN